MRTLLTIGLLWCFAQMQTQAQIVDTAAVVREVDSLILISRNFTDRGDFNNAMEINTQAEDAVLRKLGKNTAAYGSICFNRGRILFGQGLYPEAEKWYLESKEIREKCLGHQDLQYAQSLNNLANLYWATGNYDKAEKLYLEAKSIREKKLGKKSALYAASLNNLGLLYQTMGKYEEAEAFHLEAKAIREQILPSDHPDYASTLGNLAILYQYLGFYEKAEPLYYQANAIYEKLYGDQSPIFISTLNNLGLLYLKMGWNEKAEPLFIRTLALREKILGRDHPDYATTLCNLGFLYLNIGKYEKAATLFQEASNIQEKALSKEHYEYWGTISNLALTHQLMGNYEKASQDYAELSNIFEQTPGNKKHPFYLSYLYNIGIFYLAIGDYNKAEPLFSLLTKLHYAQLTKAAFHLSERELNTYLKQFTLVQNQTLSFAQNAQSQNTGIARICYDNSLFYKSFLLHNSNRITNLAANNPAAVEDFNLLKSYERRLADQYSLPVSNRDAAKVAELEESTNSLEKSLARTVAGFAEATRQVNWQDVQTALKPGTAAIEFVHYLYYTNKPTDSILYAALILKPGDTQPQFIPLFEERELTPLLKGATGGNNFLKINALYAQKNTGAQHKSLYELIWQPLESALKDSKTLYCAPSGLLHRINLAAIPSNTGQSFGDRFQLVEMGSTRQLVAPNSSATNLTDNAYLAGGIRYDSDSRSIAYANRSASSRSIEPSTLLPFQPDSISISRGGVLDYLPATAAEVRDIAHTLAGAGIRAQVDTGFYATEESFRQLGVGAPSPRIIHLATHGYFFPDPVVKVDGARGAVDGLEPVFKISEHPMIRSGLIMAGAKQAWLTGKHPEGQEDGILTAYEISQMNLAGTELVVLSACETGLGDIVGNEGVFGLQRAFKIAGAKYLIMSLWKVDDKSTQDFMTTFYKHWLTDKQPVPEAFRTTQREMRVKRPGAYDWAGFVLIE